MWYQNIEENVSSPLNDTEELEPVPYTPSPPMSPLRGFPTEIPNIAPDSDSDREDIGPPVQMTSSSSPTSVDFLLLKSLESYAAVPRTTAERQLRCECSEVLSVRTSEQLHSTTVLRPPMSQVLWPRRRHSRLRPHTPVRLSSGSETEDDIQILREDESLSDDRRSLSSTAPNSSAIRPTFAFQLKTPFQRPLPPKTHPRRRLGSIQGMPQPTLLAKQVANRVIKYARCARNIYEEDMCCLSCGFFPKCPVTGNCGHTRCTKCIEITSKCPCGNESSPPLCVNILIRDLIGKTIEGRSTSGIGKALTTTTKAAAPVNKLLSDASGSFSGPIRTKRLASRHNGIKAPIAGPYQRHIPVADRARFAHALELLNTGRHKDAAPQLALVAASERSDSRVARTLLAQVIMVLSNNRDPRGLTRELNQSVRRLSSMSGIKTNDMECILCCDILTKPVTTPCGHMFCRICLEKTLDYGKRCPLCLHGLGDFKLTETNDTVFIKGALASINALSVPKPMEEDDLVPIFVCTVAYPSISCPLFIFDRRYWMMIRRVLESGSRRFGMVAMDRDKKYADYGTILEVRDCIHFEDGRSILSTIGLSRFKVIERGIREGCEVARIQLIHDIPPDYSVAITDLRMYASRIMLKALLWLSQLGTKVLSDIENAFGSIPTTREDDDLEEWWYSTDGPSWLWWLVAVLPLRIEIKVLILSTDCLLKRMMAVDRTLDAVARVTLTTMAPGQCQLRVSMPRNDPL